MAAAQSSRRFIFLYDMLTGATLFLYLCRCHFIDAAIFDDAFMLLTFEELADVLVSLRLYAMTKLHI